MTSSARVLTGLMERRTIEAAFQELAQTQNLDQLQKSARRIAEHGNAAVPVLLSLLDTTDPQVRGGLGQVAAFLDREQVAPALRGVARARDRSDAARLTAMMILDRYLHEPVDEALLAGLQDPEAVAVQSLRELSHEMGRNPFVVLEYLNQLAEQPAEVATTVLEAIPRLGPDQHIVTLLRMFAQGPHPSLAQKALDLLAHTRSPEALLALASLAATLPPHLAAAADRGLRKLRLQGVAQPEPEETKSWRTLLSPIDGTGAQVVWFVSQQGKPYGTLFSILCKDPEGIVASFGSGEVPAEDLPAERALGSEYVIRQADDSLPITLLEVPAAVGRQAVAEALELNWARATVPPPEYRLLNPWIWQIAPADSEPDVEAGPFTAAQTAALLDHPAFMSWFWQTAPVYEAAGQLGRRSTLTERTAVISHLLETHFEADLVASYRRRLAGMARWLALAGQAQPAALARAAAVNLADIPPARHPFFQRLAGIGLDIAIANLHSGFDWRKHVKEDA